MAADVVGYSVMMAVAEEATHRLVGEEFERARKDIERGQGRVFSTSGDGFMAEFPSAVEALMSALRIQSDLEQRNQASGPEQRIVLRIGLNVGEVVDTGRLGGTTLNIAARLEQLAEPGGIALTDAVLQQVQRTVATRYVAMGRPYLKNVDDPPLVYMVPRTATAGWKPGAPPQPDLAAGSREYRPSLAVLPFRTASSDGQSYFAEGIVEDVIRALSALQDLVVISRSSTQGFANAPPDLPRIGQSLDARYVLHGQVRRSNGSLRISVELDEAHSGSVIWIEKFDGDIKELFDLQDRIALRVAQSIAPHLRRRELDRALRKHPGSLTAYDLTLRALALIYKGERQALEQAMDLLRQAIVIDPAYAPAYSHLAAAHSRRVGQGWASDLAAESAAAAQYAQSSIDRDPNDPVALAIAGHVHSYLLRDYTAATRLLDRAVAAGPSCALAWGLSSLTSGYTGRHEAAISQAEWAVRLCPIGADAGRFAAYLAQAYYLVGQYEEAVAWARVAAADASTDAANLRLLIAALMANQKTDDAQHFRSKLLQIAPDFSLAAFRLRTPLPPPVREGLIARLHAAGVPE